MDIVTYQNNTFGKLRLIEIDKVPWFIAADVLSALELSHPERTLQRWVDDEDRRTYNLQDSIYSGKRGNPNVILINESGVYSLIFTSKTDFAKAFKRWITTEVLPSIREKGYYIDRTAERLEMMEDLLSGYKELQPNKARFLHEDLIQTLKDQNKVLRAENSSLRKSLKISADRADDLEAKLTDVKENLINQLLGIESKEK